MISDCLLYQDKYSSGNVISYCSKAAEREGPWGISCCSPSPQRAAGGVDGGHEGVCSRLANRVTRTFFHRFPLAVVQVTLRLPVSASIRNETRQARGQLTAAKSWL